MLKYIQKVGINFTPYSKTSGSARVFLNYLMTDKSIATNPKCEIKTTVQSDLSLPNQIFIKFKDGKELNLKTDSIKVKDILHEVEKHNRKLALADESK